jgi:general secretion pathway protein J
MTLPPPRAATASAGFTLLELLIAITLLGLLMAALFGGLRLGARAWERSEERLDQAARLQVVQNFLRERLGQAYPLDADDEARSRFAFEGDADAIRFVTLMPEYLGAGFAEFVLAVDDRPEARDLVVRWHRFDPADPLASDEEEPQIKVLLTDIEALEVSYYGALGRSEPVYWQERWLDAAQLPELIRVGVVFPPGDRRYWPDLIVHPMTAAAAVFF